MKDDAISRKAAIELIERMKPYHQDADDIAEMIANMPPAQPEIIHCRECDYWIPGLINDNDDFIPPKCGKYQQMVGHSANDYCSYAERRTE